MPRCTRLEKSAYVLLIALSVVFRGAVTRDAWRMIGRSWTGFPVMENLLVGVGGTQRTAAEPFDLVRAVNGRLVASCRELQQEVERHPAGTRLRYLLVRGGSLVEEEIASRGMTLRDFKRFVIDNLLSGILVLSLGAIVALLQPGARTPAAAPRGTPAGGGRASGPIRAAPPPSGSGPSRQGSCGASRSRTSPSCGGWPSSSRWPWPTRSCATSSSTSARWCARAPFTPWSPRSWPSATPGCWPDSTRSSGGSTPPCRAWGRPCSRRSSSRSR